MYMHVHCVCVCVCVCVCDGEFVNVSTCVSEWAQEYMCVSVSVCVHWVCNYHHLKNSTTQMTVQLCDQKKRELAKLSRNAVNFSNLPILSICDLCFYNIDTLGSLKNESNPKAFTLFALAEQ